jgi:ABC-type uncharacterized transport system permease subunit
MTSGVLLPLGFALVCAAMALDFWIRLRMRTIGRKNVFLLGGLFNYNEYLAARKRHGWSPWPLYFMYLLLLSGIACSIVAIITMPRH